MVTSVCDTNSWWPLGDTIYLVFYRLSSMTDLQIMIQLHFANEQAKTCGSTKIHLGNFDSYIDITETC